MKLLSILLTISIFVSAEVNAYEADDDKNSIIKISHSTKQCKYHLINRDSNYVYKPFVRIYLGAFHAFQESSVTLNSEALGRGTTIDLDKTLGQKTRSIVPRAEVIVNLGKRHQISGTFWTLRRKRTHTLQEDIQFGDTTFNINTSITSKFNYSNYTANYRFSIFVRDHIDAGLSLGAKAFDVNTSIKANINGRSYEEDKRILAPVPLAGIHATIYSGTHWLFRGTGEYFRLDIKDYDFRTTDIRAGLEYYPVKHIGIGAEYHFFDINITKVPSENFDGNIDLKFHAISLYLGFRIK